VSPCLLLTEQAEGKNDGTKERTRKKRIIQINTLSPRNALALGDHCFSLFNQESAPWGGEMTLEVAGKTENKGREFEKTAKFSI
jgi:hypothetical protein